MNERAEVCPLSCRAMLQPVSRLLQPGLCFLRLPLPTTPTAFLTVRLPLPAALWAYPVPHESQSQSDPSFSPAAFRPWRFNRKGPHLAAHLLVQAYQHIWLVPCYGVYRKFTCVGRHCSSLAPHRLCAGSFHFASRFGGPVTRWLRCPRSSTRSRCQLRMFG